ncbi:MAG TPA: acyl-CoA thioesterase II [Gammaproteobacteria bacterium]|jgi:acyl-CoA thioesterase-2
MNPVLQELVDHLALERLDENTFQGPSKDIGTEQVYGGQVLGQALRAAQYTVEDRIIHSLHAYFLRRGDVNAPIVYEVDRSRDGRSFSARRVVAMQHGRPIFTLSASFQHVESGIEFQLPMPNAPDPDRLVNVSRQSADELKSAPPKFRRLVALAAPFDIRFPREDSGARPAPATRHQFWIRAVERLPDEADLHRAILAYVSDYGLLSTALRPHAGAVSLDRLQMASIDHAMWFHRPFRMDEWLLFEYEAVSTSNARGFSRGGIFDERGSLIASTAQEGLIRIRA